MIILLDDKYRITADPKQYILQVKVSKSLKNPDREQGWRSEGYFSTLSGLLNHYSERALRESDVSSLAEAVKFMETLHNNLKHLLKNPFSGA